MKSSYTKKGKSKNLFILSVCTLYWVMDAHGKFGEHERCVRVSRGDYTLKKCWHHLIYTRACIYKDFVHNGSTGLIYGKQVVFGSTLPPLSKHEHHGASNDVEVKVLRNQCIESNHLLRINIIFVWIAYQW